MTPQIKKALDLALKWQNKDWDAESPMSADSAISEANDVINAFMQALAAPVQDGHIVELTYKHHKTNEGQHTKYHPPVAPVLEGRDWSLLEATQESLREHMAEIKRLKEAQPVQKPVAWIEHEWSGSGLRYLHFERREQSVRDEVVKPIWTPLYTTPTAAQRQWVGLTTEEIYACDEESGLPEHEITNSDLQAFAYAIEAKLREKNGMTAAPEKGQP